jgi:hypothetical protein
MAFQPGVIVARQRRYVVLAVASLIQFALVAEPARADAQRYNASICQWRSHDDFDEGASFDFGEFYGSSGGSRVSCPLIERNFFRKNNVQTVNVYVHDGSSSAEVWARACHQDLGNGDVTCGSSDSTTASNVGPDTLEPSVSEWDTQYGAAFVLVQLAPNSVLFGVYVAT